MITKNPSEKSERNFQILLDSTSGKSNLFLARKHLLSITRVKQIIEQEQNKMIKEAVSTLKQAEMKQYKVRK